VKGNEMSIQNKLDELIAAQEALAAKFRAEAQQLFKEVTKEFFETNPGIKAVIWTQYTPYFNDGDECVFSVNSPTFTNAEGVDLEDVSSYGEYDGENDQVWASDNLEWALGKGRQYHKETADLIEANGGIDFESVNSFSAMLQSSEMKDVMLAMFDNHVKVVATREGFDVNEYDHD
jgi:hypothetical protein